MQVSLNLPKLTCHVLGSRWFYSWLQRLLITFAALQWVNSLQLFRRVRIYHVSNHKMLHKILKLQLKPKVCGSFSCTKSTRLTMYYTAKCYTNLRYFYSYPNVFSSFSYTQKGWKSNTPLQWVIHCTLGNYKIYC